MSSVKLAWGTAEVDDGTLTVALEGERPKDWKKSFERTVKLLGEGEWGEVKLKKDVVRVSDVAPGTEEKLRHHLESIVAQANAVDEPSDGDADEHAREQPEKQGPDAEMTERFREFAEPPQDDGD